MTYKNSRTRLKKLIHALCGGPGSINYSLYLPNYGLKIICVVMERNGVIYFMLDNFDGDFLLMEDLTDEEIMDIIIDLEKKLIEVND